MNKQDIGKRIHQIRIDLGLSMTEFGKNIDKKSPVKSGVISNWENGKQLPNKKRIKAIADLGNITINTLLYGDNITYEDIKKHIKTPKIEKLIHQQLEKFFLNYLNRSKFNYKNASKVFALTELLLEEQISDFDELINKLYKLMSNDNLEFYHHGVFVLLNEDFNKLHVQLYLTEYIYDLLIQISLDSSISYYKNLILQLEAMKEMIKEVSFKKVVYKDDESEKTIAEFINRHEYQQLFKEIDKLKERIETKDIITNE
ncbi:helix-turn-helix domain-containing protein [Staphylococcus ursi]|uniref:helix-turn-helix domain-containing protein n=1 Tax=Staphylococcus sp. MI 10-1553 TaxID=1912064 RepID=UPI001EF14346|nr:helix-turn-helix transcriptional regulator [Staphylococcus sp. MI 10-1553]